jgi:hypothetical protein
MVPNKKTIFCILILVITIASILVNYYDVATEGFSGLSYCDDCGYRSRWECSDCIDCGYCISEYGDGECVSGNEDGPFFRSDCAIWEYGKPYDPSPYPNFYNILRYPWGYWYDNDWGWFGNRRSSGSRRRRRRRSHDRSEKIDIGSNTSVSSRSSSRLNMKVSDGGIRSRIFPGSKSRVNRGGNRGTKRGGNKSGKGKK